MSFDYDVFISHAFADKEIVAIPLKDKLEAKGAKVWFDKTTLTIGDILRRKIDEGLAKSRYGIIVLSPSFFARQWPQYELDGLLAREMADAVKVILPVWHNVTQSQVMAYSAPLSMRLGGKTDNLDALVEELSSIIWDTTGGATVSEILDDVSLAKQAILTGALPTTTVRVFEGDNQHGRYVQVDNYGFDDTEKQRKLFLYALEELMRAGLIEHISGIVYELTYEGIQVAERMQRLEHPETLGA